MSNLSIVYIEPGVSEKQIEVELFTKYKTIDGSVREFVVYNQEDNDKLGLYRTAADKDGKNVYSRLHNDWGCDNGRCTGAPTDHPENLLIINDQFVLAD